MSKKRELFEHFKTVLLVVLFLITILLLYLQFNRQGKSLSISDIMPGGRRANLVISVDEYLLPSCTVKSDGFGRYKVSYQRLRESFDTASFCAGSLLSSSNVNITEIEREEFDSIIKEAGSVMLVFDYDIPFDDFCLRYTGKTLEKPENFSGFRAILFSDIIKSNLYFRSVDGVFFKVAVAENYYSTEALARIVEFEAETGFDGLFAPGFRDNDAEIELDRSDMAEGIFGDTLDFVRKISDGFGNETYMYGYGQKRLSIYTNGEIEFKRDISGVNTPDFYKDLEVALRLLEETIGIEERNIILKSAKLADSDGEKLFQFVFRTGQYVIVLEVKQSLIAYFSLRMAN